MPFGAGLHWLKRLERLGIHMDQSTKYLGHNCYCYGKSPGHEQYIWTHRDNRLFAYFPSSISTRRGQVLPSARSSSKFSSKLSSESVKGRLLSKTSVNRMATICHNMHQYATIHGKVWCFWQLLICKVTMSHVSLAESTSTLMIPELTKWYSTRWLGLKIAWIFHDITQPLVIIQWLGGCWVQFHCSTNPWMKGPQ